MLTPEAKLLHLKDKTDPPVLVPATIEHDRGRRQRLSNRTLEDTRLKLHRGHAILEAAGVVAWTGAASRRSVASCKGEEKNFIQER